MILCVNSIKKSFKFICLKCYNENETVGGTLLGNKIGIIKNRL